MDVIDLEAFVGDLCIKDSGGNCFSALHYK